jgi:dehydratase
MKLTTRRCARVLATTLLALTPVVASAIPASAVTQKVTFQCLAETSGGSTEGTLIQDVDGSAPSTVEPGKDLTIVLTPAAQTIPSVGGTIKEIKDITLKVPFPTSATYRSSSLSGGVGLGTVALSDEGDALVITATGPVPAGTTFQLPALNISVTANNSGTINSVLGGGSFAQPSLTFTAIAVLGAPVDVSVSCYPDPNPVLTSTTITR